MVLKFLNTKQLNILPDVPWQHITFTMPDVLWDFFAYNRKLLNIIPKLAAKCIKKIAKDKKVVTGIFIAIHTFGRDLKFNVHIHLSVTLGGLSFDSQKWKKLFFKQQNLVKMWRYEIINLLRMKYHSFDLVIPHKISEQLNHTFTFNDFLDKQYQIFWHVFCAKQTNNQQQNVDYFARYVKRPPIAESRLRHYDGNFIIFKYLDHKTKSMVNKTLSVKDFIKRLIRHIPDQGFRLIRYYGFLANRVRGKLLPKVREVLGIKHYETQNPTSFVKLMIQNFNVNPMQCTLCGSDMRLAYIKFGISNISKLLLIHRQLALLRKI